jgi:hypothetical protein
LQPVLAGEQRQHADEGDLVPQVVLEPQPHRVVPLPPEVAERGVLALQALPHRGLVGAGVRCDEARAAGQPSREVAVLARRSLADRVGEAEVFAGDACARQALAQVVAAAEVERRRRRHQDGFGPALRIVVAAVVVTARARRTQPR